MLLFMSKSVLPMFSSRSFTVSSLTFRPLIHFDFIYVYGVRESFFFFLVSLFRAIPAHMDVPGLGV